MPALDPVLCRPRWGPGVETRLQSAEIQDQSCTGRGSRRACTCESRQNRTGSAGRRGTGVTPVGDARGPTGAVGRQGASGRVPRRRCRHGSRAHRFVHASQPLQKQPHAWRGRSLGSCKRHVAQEDARRACARVGSAKTKTCTAPVVCCCCPAPPRGHPSASLGAAILLQQTCGQLCELHVRDVCSACPGAMRGWVPTGSSLVLPKRPPWGQPGGSPGRACVPHGGSANPLGPGVPHAERWCTLSCRHRLGTQNLPERVAPPAVTP